MLRVTNIDWIRGNETGICRKERGTKHDIITKRMRENDVPGMMAIKNGCVGIIANRSDNTMLDCQGVICFRQMEDGRLIGVTEIREPNGERLLIPTESAQFATNYLSMTKL